MRKIFVLFGIAISVCSFFLPEKTAFGHQEGAPFSGAIIDPLAAHHAYIENEQRINFSLVNHVVEFDHIHFPDSRRYSPVASPVSVHR